MKILFAGSIPGHQPGTGQSPGPEHQELFKPRRIALLTLDDTEVPVRFTDSLRQAGDERHKRELALIKIVREEHST